MKSQKNHVKLMFIILVVGLVLSYSSFPTFGHPTSIVSPIIQPIFIIGGTQGNQVEQFDEPDGVAVSSDGTIYVGDTLNLRIQVFDKDGNYVKNLTGFSDVSQNEVQGVAINSLGEICVIDMFGAKIRILDPNGTQIHEFGAKGSNSGEFQEPQGIATDSENRIFVVDTQRNTVLLFHRNGSFITEFGASSLGAPESILIDESNSRILVASEAAHKIVIFDYLSFTLLTEFGNTGPGKILDDPEGIVLDSDGNIILNDEGAGRISVFFTNLTFFQSFGSFGSASGYFNSPDGLAFDHTNQRLVVADQGNYRVQVFNWTEVMEVLTALPPAVELTTTTEDTTVSTSPSFSFAPVLISLIVFSYMVGKNVKKNK